MTLHRRQPGICDLCGTSVSRTAAARHFAECAPRHDAKGELQTLVQLRITAPHHAGYWLDIEARVEARLDALDRFLRSVWLECCGHLSRFTVSNVEYFSSGYELGRWSLPGRSVRVERSMNVKLGEALPPTGGRVAYEYDFGSSTELVIAVGDERQGRLGRRAVRLLGRNTPLEWPCALCGEPATQICATCRYESPNPFVCDAHASSPHECGEDMYLLIVNSPRMGVCGYGG